MAPKRAKPHADTADTLEGDDGYDVARVTSTFKDGSENQTGHSRNFAEPPPIQIATRLNRVYNCLVGAGVEPSYAVFRLLNIEPFSHFPTTVEALLIVDIEH